MAQSFNNQTHNQIAQYLGKPSRSFTRRDLIRFIEGNKIEILNFRYVGGDGRLKALSFVINNRAQLDNLLARGERVDGSSLFSYIDAASSDLYVMPRYQTAYVNPFSVIPTVEILCSFYTSQGVRLTSSPENIVHKAHEVLKAKTGFTLEAMGELEYYVIANKQSLYPMTEQRGYQSSAPFAKWESLRIEAMRAIAQAGGEIKYGHTEVGYIAAADKEMEQHEIEFMPVALEDAADQIVLAKWVLRMLGYKYGVTISFAPKILVGHAGSGLHIHSRLMRDGKNMMVENGQLSNLARKLIAGYLKLAPSLTAFGNTVPVSYLRLVPKQEAPTNICWGDRNRSVLVRVPLGWLNVKDMFREVNPQEKVRDTASTGNQTIEFRCPDGSANIHLLLAGLAVAARYGLTLPGALTLAERCYVASDGFNRRKTGQLPQLPVSCWSSAEQLLAARKIYETDHVFSGTVIEGIVNKLRSYHDQNLSQRLYGKQTAIKKLLDEYLHCS